MNRRSFFTRIVGMLAAATVAKPLPKPTLIRNVGTSTITLMPGIVGKRFVLHPTQEVWGYYR